MNSGSKVFVVGWYCATYTGIGPVIVVDRYNCDYHLAFLFDEHAKHGMSPPYSSTYVTLDAYKEKKFDQFAIPIRDFNITVGEGVEMVMKEVLSRNMSESIPLMYRELILRIYKISEKSVSRHTRPGFDQKGRRI